MDVRDGQGIERLPLHTVDVVTLHVQDGDSKVDGKPGGRNLEHGVRERRNGPFRYGGHNLRFGTPNQVSW